MSLILDIVVSRVRLFMSHVNRYTTRISFVQAEESGDEISNFTGKINAIVKKSISVNWCYTYEK